MKMDETEKPYSESLLGDSGLSWKHEYINIIICCY